MYINNWIFDFDGVLARPLSDEIRVLRQYTHKDQSEEQIKEMLLQYFSKPRHSRKNNLTEEEIQAKHTFIKEYTEHVLAAENEVFTEFIDHFVSAPHSRFAVVSSGSEKYLHHILGDYTSHFDFIYGFETSMSKEDKVEMVSQAWGISPTQSRYFTDTPSDVIELRDLVGIDNIYGCSWGWCGLEPLSQVLPREQIFISFSDILKLTK